MQQVREGAPKILLPLQCGVAVPDAVSQVIHTMRACQQAAAANTQLGILQVDVSAFNENSRAAILSYLGNKLPALARWAWWSLSQKGKLMNGETTVGAERGVQQGDPLAPLLFACGVQKPLQELHARHPSLLNLWYLDDGHVFGDVSALDRFSQEVTPALGTVGLRVNSRKCHVYSLTDYASCPNLSTDGLEVLGSAVGSDSFVQKVLSRKFLRARDFCELVPRLQDPQIALALLRMCGGACRVVHLLRTVPPNLVRLYATQLDDTMLESFRLATGVPHHPCCSTTSFFIPHQLGGLGLQMSAPQCAEAFWTAYLSFTTPEAESFPRLPQPLAQLLLQPDVAASLT